MSWADLWARPEQQTIAQRREAFAEIQGQQYREAAQHLEPFRDPVSLYNKGNALARAGDLKAALDAYDAALKDPATTPDLHRDAQHNRDLVAQQLKSQQKPDKSDKGDKGDKGDQSDKDDKDGKGDKSDNSDKSDGSDKSGKDGQDAKAGQKGADDKSRPDDNAAQDAKNGESGKDQGKDQAKDRQAAPSKDQDQAKDQAAAAPAPSGDTKDGERRPGDAASAEQAEHAQSLDQWLRFIPDDPSGLLRRKFMIEHMLNQREAQK